MKIEVNQNECQLIKIALVYLAKQTNTTESEMMRLLILSNKFVWVEETKKVRKVSEKKNSKK